MPQLKCSSSIFKKIQSHPTQHTDQHLYQRNEKHRKKFSTHACKKFCVRGRACKKFCARGDTPTVHHAWGPCHAGERGGELSWSRGHSRTTRQIRNAMDYHLHRLPCPVPAGGRVRWRLVQCCARCCLLESPWRNLFCINPAACPPMIVIDVLFCQTPNCFRRANTSSACSSRLDGRCMPPFNFCATATTASSSSARQASY
jgi:hypothetical protein